jgi:hypothetical protein
VQDDGGDVARHTGDVGATDEDQHNGPVAAAIANEIRHSTVLSGLMSERRP